MPRTRSIAWSELKLGSVAVVAFVMAAALVVAVGGQGGFFWQRYSLKTRFDTVEGLKKGAVVRVNGVEVGRVAGLEFIGSQVEIVMQVSKDVRPLITSESVATLGSMSMLGEPLVDVTASGQGTPLSEWAYVKHGEPGGVQSLASSLFDDIRSGRGTLGKLVTDQKLYDNLNRAAIEMRSLFADIRKDPKKFLHVGINLIGR